MGERSWMWITDYDIHKTCFTNRDWQFAHFKLIKGINIACTPFRLYFCFSDIDEQKQFPL